MVAPLGIIKAIYCIYATTSPVSILQHEIQAEKIRLNIAIEKGQNAMIVTTQSTNARYILKVLMVALCKAQRLDIDIIRLPNKFELWIGNHE